MNGETAADAYGTAGHAIDSSSWGKIAWVSCSVFQGVTRLVCVLFSSAQPPLIYTCTRAGTPYPRNPSLTPAWSFSYSVSRLSSATIDFFRAQGGGSNGRIPVNILYTVTPRDHQSTASLYPCRWSLL